MIVWPRFGVVSDTFTANAFISNPTDWLDGRRPVRRGHERRCSDPSGVGSRPPRGHRSRRVAAPAAVRLVLEERLDDVPVGVEDRSASRSRRASAVKPSFVVAARLSSSCG